MSRLQTISSNPMLRQFAQGAAQSAIMPVADFIAPTIEVPTSTGRFKKYTEKHRFHIPKTLRTLGGRASELRFEVTDATYNCEPHALDYPVDNLEQLESEGLENMLREGAVAVAEVALHVTSLSRRAGVGVHGAVFTIPHRLEVCAGAETVGAEPHPQLVDTPHGGDRHRHEKKDHGRHDRPWRGSGISVEFNSHFGNHPFSSYIFNILLIILDCCCGYTNDIN